jgi:hypothetical protein
MRVTKVSLGGYTVHTRLRGQQVALGGADMLDVLQIDAGEFV